MSKLPPSNKVKPRISRRAPMIKLSKNGRLELPEGSKLPTTSKHQSRNWMSKPILTLKLLPREKATKSQGNVLYVVTRSLPRQLPCRFQRRLLHELRPKLPYMSTWHMFPVRVTLEGLRSTVLTFGLLNEIPQTSSYEAELRRNARAEQISLAPCAFSCAAHGLRVFKRAFARDL